MKSIMEDIATSIPTDFGTAAAAVGEVSTRFGVTGDDLEDLSGKFVKFANLNNSDVTTSVDTVQKAMAAWGLSAEDAGAFMDTLTKAAQDTGANATNLATVVADNKTAFDEMGFSVSDATMWLANLEKNGVAAEDFQFVLGNIADDASVQYKALKASDGEGYDIVCANIIAEILAGITPAVPPLLKKGGVYITSGILQTHAQLVRDAMAEAGLTILEETPMGEWESITARK
jgi:ribosomal protein L11 methylase PrmA